MGVKSIYEEFNYYLSKQEKISLENYYEKPINEITTKEFRKWFKKVKK